MIYYCSEKTLEDNDLIKKITVEQALKYLSKLDYIGLDTETSGLDEYSLCILIGLGNQEHQFIFDFTVYDKLKDILQNPKITFIGHTLKFDLKILFTNLGIWVEKHYDTMIAEQRIYQGFGKTDKNPFGIKFDLDSTIYRHLKLIRLSDKESSRKSFIGKTKETYVFTLGDVLYLAEDVNNLVPLRAAQIRLIYEYNLIRQQTIEQKLVRVLAEAEVEGFDFDTVAWKKVIKENKDLKYQYELKLDEIFKQLRENCRVTNRLYLTGGKFDNRRGKELDITEMVDIFGSPINVKSAFGTGKSKRILKAQPNKVEKINFNPNCISWSSALDLHIIFGKLELPLPTKSGVFLIPLLDSRNKIINNKGIREEDLEEYRNNPDNFAKTIFHEGFTLGADSFLTYLKIKPNTVLKEFIETYKLYSEVTTAITNFGENYLKKIHPVTGKLHTIYRQCDAITGRLQSGGGHKQPDKINSQNIKRDNKYRNCFIASEGTSLITADLSGAEVVIMADKSGDKNLIKLAIEQDDIHSPVAQQSWRNIYLFKACNTQGICHTAEDFWKIKKQLHKELFTKNKAIEYYQLSKTFEVTKSINKHLRTGFKPITFGVVYGAYAAKVAQVLNISVQEAQIVIDTIKQIMPDVFSFIQSNLDFTFGKKYKYNRVTNPEGYLILNNRTNSRLSFPQVYKAMSTNTEMDFKEESKLQGVARNAPIQGTQADMIKEAMVELWTIIKSQKLPKTCILIQVHDELVVKCDKRMDGSSEEWRNNPIYTKYKGQNLDFPSVVGKVMTDTANLYLKRVKMKVDYQVLPYWVK